MHASLHRVYCQHFCELTLGIFIGWLIFSNFFFENTYFLHLISFTVSNTDHNTKVYNGLSSLFSKFVKNDFYLCALCFFSDKNYVNALTTVCRSIYINFFVCCSINFEFFSAILKENVSSDRKALQRAVQKSESSASNISKYKRVHQNIMMRALNT